MRLLFFRFLLVCILVLPLAKPNPVVAQTNTGETPQESILEARIVKIIDEKSIDAQDDIPAQLYQKLELVITNGEKTGNVIQTESGDMPIANIPQYRIGDSVMVAAMTDIDGNTKYQIIDYVRRNSLINLFTLFILIAILIARWRGITSLIGMGISFGIIFSYMLPTLSAGGNPLTTTLITAGFVIPITFFLSHGFNRKTLVAVLGTLLALITTGIIAQYFIFDAKLTGFASEEAGFLLVAKQGSVNIQGLILAGILISVLGILDDITISQSAIAFELKKANRKLKFRELYRMTMNIGHDHIASMINTLVLIYAGAALPLLLLFINNPRPYGELLNYEIIADEVVRTLVSSIGLMLAVPITTTLACIAAIQHDNPKQ